VYRGRGGAVRKYFAGGWGRTLSGGVMQKKKNEDRVIPREIQKRGREDENAMKTSRRLKNVKSSELKNNKTKN